MALNNPRVKGVFTIQNEGYIKKNDNIVKTPDKIPEKSTWITQPFDLLNKRKEVGNFLEHLRKTSVPIKTYLDSPPDRFGIQSTYNYNTITLQNLLQDQADAYDSIAYDPENDLSNSNYKPEKISSGRLIKRVKNPKLKVNIAADRIKKESTSDTNDTDRVKVKKFKGGDYRDVINMVPLNEVTTEFTDYLRATHVLRSFKKGDDLMKKLLFNDYLISKNHKHISDYKLKTSYNELTPYDNSSFETALNKAGTQKYKDDGGNKILFRNYIEWKTGDAPLLVDHNK